MVVFAISASVAAALIAVPLYAFGHVIRPPMPIGVGLAALLIAGLIALRIDLPSSSWQVPVTWARYGHVGHCGLFGAVLGSGVITRLASPSLLLVLLWAVAEQNTPGAILPTGIFGLARAGSTLTVASLSRGSSPRLIGLLGWFQAKVIGPVRVAEVAVLASTGAYLLLFPAVGSGW